MQNVYEIVVQLTSSQPPANHKARMLNDFAYKFGWQPSDSLTVASVSELANAHLVVEYGLENTAVLTFLRGPRRFSDLDFAERNTLLGISYNNLVDWHLYIQADEVAFVFNLTDPPKVVESHRISRDNISFLRSEVFEQITGKRPSPNIPALDNALIETISFWKRSLSAEMNYSISNEELSTLFNAIIFARAAEDHFRRFGSSVTQTPTKTLLEDWIAPGSTRPPVRKVILRNLRKHFTELPSYLIDEKLLRGFDRLDRDTVGALLGDFYRNKYAPYEYDFSLISKHALSRIYEHYVSLLSLEDDRSPQATLFPRLPEAERNKSYGSIYTPQFIARFFARYLREQMPPASFKRIQTLDPACGSGIFLRSLLEVQCDPTSNELTTDQIQSLFQSVSGMDIDKNACHATRLSLSLLFMVLTDRLPSGLKVVSAEGIDYYLSHPEMKESCDAIVANPPFVALTTQSLGMRTRVAEFMGKYASGRIDSYLPFLLIGLESLRPGGYAFFVLPHSFLLSASAEGMRKLISETAWIRCVADLSAIRVFDNTGSYVILLIFQKKPNSGLLPPPTTVIECQDLVGRALQDAVDGRKIITPLYKVYDVGQETFENSQWLMLPPDEAALKKKLASFPRIDKFLQIRQGFISGADTVFIVDSSEIPSEERAVFVPYLSDREMKPFSTPSRTSQYFFYPYIDGEKIDERELKSRFPKTWKYLKSHRTKLEGRGSLEKYHRAWWEPMWSRPPENMMRAKIVTPHLTLLPRFSLDLKGKYAVSRSPLLYPKEGAFEGRLINEDDLLRFFLAVLNSSTCYWFISQHSHVYRGGYVMLESKTLATTPVPNPVQVTPIQFRNIVKLVDDRLKASEAQSTEIENSLDRLVAELYGLSKEECSLIGIGEN
jgi:hypothetical protein